MIYDPGSAAVPENSLRFYFAFSQVVIFMVVSWFEQIAKIHFALW